MRIPRPERLAQAARFAIVIAAESALLPLVLAATRLRPCASEEILRAQNRLRAHAISWLQPHLRAPKS